MDSGLSSTEALLLGQNSNRGMFGGGDDAWILFLFFLFGYGGNGFGWGNNGFSNQVNNDFLYTNLSNQLGRGQDRIENTLGQGFTQIANRQFDFTETDYTCFDFAYWMNMKYSDYGEITQDFSTYVKYTIADLEDEDYQGDASERAYYDAMEKINYRKHH